MDDSSLLFSILCATYFLLTTPLQIVTSRYSPSSQLSPFAHYLVTVVLILRVLYELRSRRKERTGKPPRPLREVWAGIRLSNFDLVIYLILAVTMVLIGTAFIVYLRYPLVSLRVYSIALPFLFSAVALFLPLCGSCTSGGRSAGTNLNAEKRARRARFSLASPGPRKKSGPPRPSPLTCPTRPA